MGIDVNGARFLLDAGHNGVVFDICATLGRQELFVSAEELRMIFGRFSLPMSGENATRVAGSQGGKRYAESFLDLCGAKQIVSFDNSDYESAAVVHDMNREVPGEYHGRFDCVIDGGTLEHVFNFPVAIRNCMRMVKPGGHFLAMTPCNNFMGHGFYQFSPELFYGVFSESNGFSVERMFIFESRPNAQWYRVADPKRIGGRVELVNSAMTYLLVQARRVAVRDLSDITPQQSDYVLMWDEKNPSAVMRGDDPVISAFTRFKGMLKGNLRRAARVIPVESLRTPFCRPWYEPYE